MAFNNRINVSGLFLNEFFRPNRVPRPKQIMFDIEGLSVIGFIAKKLVTN